MMMVEEEYVEEFDQSEEDAASLLFSKKSELAVFPRDFRKAYHLAFGQIPSLKIAPIVGMAGIGKTTLAKEIFHHPNITSFFECLVWVKVGENCPAERIRRSILQQILQRPDEEGDERYLRELLEARRYLIVLDDVWELELWRELRNLFNYKRDHSAVILTTRLQDVALAASDRVIQMSLLNRVESWDLLRKKVFGENSCPYNLEEAGKKIAKKCDGLPLMIVTIAEILLETERTRKRWNEIAEDEQSDSVFKDAYGRTYEELYRSYYHLCSNPVMIPCFLYMGAFPQKYEIPTSKLIKLWSSEGFLYPSPSKTSAEITLEYLEWLHSRSLVLTVQDSSNGGVKTWRLHSVFWYLCNVEASKEQVFKGLNSYQDFSSEETGLHCRFSINSSALLTVRDIHDEIASIPNVQSLLCFGPYHRYPVRLYFHSVSLKVIDVLSIRFYDFPREVIMLQLLRNLTLTCSGNLPATISKLKFLEFLIIQRHLSIKSSSGVSRDLPVEVWEMKSLKHLQVTGSNLPHPNGDSVLPNLLTLLDVGSQT